jgi:serine phosphatase RsbU (regulator of sigma subunit)
MPPPARPPDDARARLGAVAGWVLATVGAAGVVLAARDLDEPLVPVAALTAVVIVVAGLAGGALPASVAAVVAGLAAWAWLDPLEPMTAAYPTGLALGGVVLALVVGAVLQLRSFEQARASWRARADALSEELSGLDGSEDEIDRVRDAARRASGAEEVELLPVDRSTEVGLPEGWTEVRSRTAPPIALRVRGVDPPPAVLAPDFTAFLRTIADQCSQAVQRTELAHAERRASADLELLARSSSALSSTLDVDQVIATVEDLVVPAIADRCSLRIATRPGQRRRREPPLPPDDDRTRTVTLLAHGALIGHLTLLRTDRPLSGRDVDAALLIAEPIARALDHALLYAEQVATSSTLEHSLLPAAILPVEHLEVATRYLAAAEGHAAGVDFYDVIAVPSGAVLVVGDVQGKGVEAATLTSTARHTLRAAALAGASPAGMLDQLNAALLYGQSERLVATGGQPSIRFVTASVVALSPTESGFRAVVASGGHPPPLVIHPAGTVDPVRADGVLLGVFADAHYQEREVSLCRSDMVVLYTDGVTEQRAQPDLFNEAQLGHLVRNMRTARRVDAEAAAQLILDTVVGLNPREVRDDIALVVARVIGP